MISFNLPRTELKGMLNFAAKKDIRYYLNGVCLEIGNKEVRILATDGHVMGVQRVLLEEPIPLSEQFQVIISTDDIKAIQKSKYDTPLKISIDAMQSDGKRYISIDDNGTIRTFPALDGEYPDYRRVIPSSVSNETAQYNHELLVKFQDYSNLFNKKGQNISVEYNGNSGALVSIGRDSFIGVIMPIRADETNSAPTWATDSCVTIDQDAPQSTESIAA